MTTHFKFQISNFRFGTCNPKSQIPNPKSPLLNPEPRTLNPFRRGGYTLTELLIVIFIMVILVSITLPTVKRVMEDGNVREASRQFNAYIAMAKARALQTGRPCGIMLRCDLPSGITADPPGTAGFPDWTQRIVSQMYLAEVPPPYSGSTLGSLGKIWPGGPAGARVFESVGEMPYLGTLVEEGEFFLVRFNFKGEWYRCQRGIGPSAGICLFLENSMTKPPGYNDATNAGGWPFQILRMPRRIGNPLELSAGTCIDLAYSGIGPSNLPSQTIRYGMYPCNALGQGPNQPGLFPGTPPAPPRLQYITVMFQPDGGIESVFLNNYFFAPSTTVHFLVGRSDKVSAPYGSSTHGTGFNMYDPNTSNLADPLSLWVSVSRTTGNVNTSENSPPASDLATISPNLMRITSGTAQQVIDPSTTGDQALYLALCRQLATNREQIRGQ